MLTLIPTRFHPDTLNMAKLPIRHKKKLTAGRFLKLTRVAVSCAMLSALTMLVTTLEAKVALALDWGARLQLMPLALSGAGTAVALWLASAMLFGRVYCSTVCPMGVLQDCFSRMHRRSRSRRARHPFRYTPPQSRFRYAFFTAVVGCIVVGESLLPMLFDPYSAFARIGTDLLRPVWQWIGGAPVFVASWLAFGIALVTLILVAWASYRRGRIVCNTVCPVGSALSIFSRFALFHFEIDTDLCVNCRKCEHVCKAECINMSDHVVDGSRCVACFNCVDVCDSNAIRYTYRRKKLALPMMQRIESASTARAIPTPDQPKINDNASGKIAADGGTPLKIDRRKFLATGLILAATPALSTLAGGKKRIAAIETRGKPLEATRAVAPPGRRNMAEFFERCTGCGLCVAHCPAKVLKPSSNELGWLHMLHPVMDYEHSYCRYNCTRCTDICPTGALLPLTVEEKHVFILGQAHVESANCIGCGLCASRCPRRAISMVVRPSTEPGSGLMVARVNSSACIGCGACEYICPATPVKAIGVNGIV